LRTIKDTKKTSKPYEGFYAKLTINKDVFIIEDNCGGIPKSFREYAFKMGRPHQKEEENEGTVGVYGIGMKRAIFKMGRDCSIQSNNPDGAFTVDITPDWIDGDGWKIPMHESDYDNKNPTGTTIEIKKLHSNVAQKFNESTYLT
ncbi:ATP-binding protein, partial [Escherichia coli]